MDPNPFPPPAAHGVFGFVGLEKTWTQQQRQQQGMVLGAWLVAAGETLRCCVSLPTKVAFIPLEQLVGEQVISWYSSSTEVGGCGGRDDIHAQGGLNAHRTGRKNAFYCSVGEKKARVPVAKIVAKKSPTF